MSKHTMHAETRTVFGRKVKELRREGKMPVTVYGKGVENLSASVDVAEFDKVYREAGETGLIDLKVGGDVRPVLIHSVQTDPMSRLPLHVEFHQVDLKVKVTANVPLVLEGEPAAVKEKLGMLLALLSEVEVETLPSNIPEHIIVDVSGLAQLDDQITVADLKVPADVTVMTDGSVMVAKIGALAAPEPVEEAAPAAPEEGAAPAPEAETPATE